MPYKKESYKSASAKMNTGKMQGKKPRAMGKKNSSKKK